MTDRDEFDDDRDHANAEEPRSGANGDRGPGGGPGDDSLQPFGPGYMENLLAMEDSPVKPGSLDLLVPGLHDRWPEPRLLNQRELWFQQNRIPVAVDTLDAEGARRLLRVIVGLAEDLHRVAARDEALTTSSGIRWALASAGVPMVEDLDPLSWLESTLLVRHLRDTCA